MSRQSKKVVAAVDELTQEEREVGGREVGRSNHPMQGSTTNTHNAKPKQLTQFQMQERVFV